MEFNYSYRKDSSVRSDARSTSMSPAPDTRREPTFFSGQLRQALEFREAISALHDVVVSDLRWHPKDRTAYKEWAARQEELDWAEVASQQRDVAAQLRQVRDELEELRKRSAKRSRGFESARQRYFNYLYRRDYDAWIVLDPVVTVHPDEVFFECFSRDESSYGRLGANYEVFEKVGEYACGTTNVDYSAAMYDEFQKIRSYKTTKFEVDPTGFEVQTGDDEAHKEVKIDLPDSWVRGFLQVSSAAAMPSTRIELHPMDIHNICLLLRRNRELTGPRAMRFRLQPDRPVRIVFEPWEHSLECPRSTYLGDPGPAGEQEQEIRVWGRRRLLILERLIPIARKFTVHLLGKGMPSFYVADLGDLTFTLGLSGWTANDWASSANFDLLAPRVEVDAETQRRVFAALKENWVESPEALATRLGLDRSVVHGVLSAYTQAGRAIWDLDKQVYRVRELTRDPLPMEGLRFASDREQQAIELINRKAARIAKQFLDPQRMMHLEGVVKVGNQTYRPQLKIDLDERVVDGACQCNWYQQNQLRKGLCQCMLAIRLLHARSIRGGWQLRQLFQ